MTAMEIRGAIRPTGGRATGGADANECVETIELGALCQDEELQIRLELNPKVVNTYENVLKAGVQLPPITVARIGGVNVLVDGWHRVAAMARMGVHETRARVVAATRDEARWLAAKANLTHGLPLKSAEVREAFRVYVRTRRHRERDRYKSYRLMAADLGGVKSYNTIRNWMQKDFPKIAKAIGDGGESFQDNGGLRPLPEETPIATARRSVRAAFDTATAQLADLRDESERQQLLQEAVDALERLAVAAGVTLVPVGAVESQDF